MSIDTRYQRDGYIVLPSVFSQQELEDLRHQVDALYEQPNDATRHHLSLYTASPLFAALSKHPFIVEQLTKLIGPHIQLQHSKLAVKPQTPETGAFGMHQDFAYYPHTNSDVCAVFIALDNCTTKNGCLYVVPGSHKWGLLNHHVDGAFAGACVEHDAWTSDQEIPLLLQAGDVSIHHGFCLHGSPVNKSGSPRRALVYSYRAADAYQMDGNIYPETGMQVHGMPSAVARLEAANYRLPYMPRGAYADTIARHQAGSLIATEDVV